MSVPYLFYPIVAYVLFVIGHFIAYYSTLRLVREYGAFAESNKYRRKEFAEGTHRRGFVKGCIVFGVVLCINTVLVYWGLQFPFVVEVTIIVIGWGDAFYDVVVVPVIERVIDWRDLRRIQKQVKTLKLTPLRANG